MGENTIFFNIRLYNALNSLYLFENQYLYKKIKCKKNISIIFLFYLCIFSRFLVDIKRNYA
ncbi:hypothetical protein CGC56_11085 [Capnocytophaga canimorsus]|uniref:Uncharacterized protein n=1 Tax=Capnocytophaga canimorsus TaxID=28188 RepID=A0A250G8I8_9FLAO|nr:hypothetical protein CGC56_11085 [Capnocytophaga canimorsus]